MSLPRLTNHVDTQINLHKLLTFYSSILPQFLMFSDEERRQTSKRLAGALDDHLRFVDFATKTSCHCPACNVLIGEATKQTKLLEKLWTGN